jgi:hypothetical protein
MDAEHRRRHEETRSIAEQQCRDREWVEKLQTRAADLHGDAGLRSGDLELASRLRLMPRCCGRCVTWKQALEKPWGVALCRRLAELARARQTEPPTDLDAAIGAIEDATWREFSETGSP